MSEGKKRPRSLRYVGLALKLVEGKMGQRDLILAAGRVRWKKEKIEKKQGKKSAPPRNPPRNPQQPGDRVQLEIAGDETRPTC